MSVLQLSVATVVLAGVLSATLVAVRGHQRKRRARHRAPDSALLTAAAVTPVVSIALVTAALSSSSSGSRADAKTSLPVTVELAPTPSTSPTGIPEPEPALKPPTPIRPAVTSEDHTTFADTPTSTTTADTTPEQHKSPPVTSYPTRTGPRRLRLAVPSSVTGTFRERVVRAVQDVLGTPYRYGAESPTAGFDCSGLTMWAYSRAGIQLPRIADDQMRSMKSIHVPTPGDLVFFLDGGGHAYHAGVYVSPGHMIAAPKTGDHVRVETIWTDAVSYRAAV